MTDTHTNGLVLSYDKINIICVCVFVVITSNVFYTHVYSCWMNSHDCQVTKIYLNKNLDERKRKKNGACVSLDGKIDGY